MSVWSWIAGIVAGAAIIFLIATGSDDRTFAGRERQAFYARSVLSMVAMPASTGTDVAMTIVEPPIPQPSGRVQQDIAGSISEVQQLLATAATQPADQQKATLQQAQEKLDATIKQVDKAADDTSNDATRIQLLRL